MRTAVAQVREVFGDVAAATRTIREVTTIAADNGAALVVFPEGFLQGYRTTPEHVSAHALELASTTFLDVCRALSDAAPIVVFGLIERERTRYFNTAVAIERGTLVARYRKRHLLPSEHAFQPGESTAIFEVDGVPCSLAICRDLASESTFSDAKAAGADLIVAPCNNMLSHATAERWRERHSFIREGMAERFGLWLAAADVTGERSDAVALGPTSIIDPQGGVIAQVPTGSTGLAYADIPTV